MNESLQSKFYAIIQDLCLFDDFFFKVVVTGRNDIIELILNIILNMNLTVIETDTQKEIKSINGRTVILDVLAKDDNGKLYNIEIQNENAGAIPERARYHASMVDTRALDKGSDFSDLPETYIIFITRNDVLKGDLPIYHVERKITELDNKPFNDKQHIIYVNGAYTSEDALGKLIADFKCKDPDKMNYEVLAKRADYYKHSEEGQMKMTGIAQQLFEEGRLEERAIARAEKEQMKKEFIANFLKRTNLTQSEIASNLDVTLSEVEAIAKELNSSTKPTL